MIAEHESGSGIEVDRNGLEVLSHEECLRLLASASVGRIGMTWDALPAVLPVNIALASLPDGEGPELVIRSVEGTKFHAALARTVVAVEVDEIDPVRRMGWSVMVRGSTRVIEDPCAVEEARRLALAAWASVAADRFVAVDLAIVTGRRITLDRGQQIISSP